MRGAALGAVLASLLPFPLHASEAPVPGGDPPPPSALRLAGEFVVGTAYGFAGGYTGAALGFMADMVATRGCGIAHCTGGTPGLYIGAGVGASLAIPTGVKWVGDGDGYHGSYSSAYLGTLLGGIPMIVLLSTGTYVPVLSESSLFLPVVGAMVGYHLSRRPKGTQATESASLITVQKGRLALELPRPQFTLGNSPIVMFQLLSIEN